MRTKEVGVQRGAAAEEYVRQADEYVRLFGVSLDKLHTAVGDAESCAKRYALVSFF